MPRALFAALLALGLGACVPYPAYRTTQPAAELQVLDEQGQALAGANVTLIARAHPTPFEQSRETRSTDAEGIARFASQHEWQTEVMFLHGRLDYYWEWCVTAADYQTALIPFSTPLQIRLQRGASEPCPAPRN